MPRAPNATVKATEVQGTSACKRQTPPEILHSECLSGLTLVPAMPTRYEAPHPSPAERQILRGSFRITCSTVVFLKVRFPRWILQV